MNERRYKDDEVRQIIESAALSDGLTLAEIQSVAKEVGIDADDVARAASLLTARSGAGIRKTLGMPLAVSHSAELNRAMTDVEWERLVGTLREVFNAKGRVTSTGGIREWSNSNLRVYVEPSANGYRIRMTTRKGNATTLNALGVGGMTAGIVTSVLALVSPQPDGFLPVLFFVGAIAALVSNYLRLPPWAARRLEQMMRIGKEAQDITENPT